MVFQEGFLRSRTGANVGWAKVGLTSLIGDAARRYIEDRGGEVRLEDGIRRVNVGAGQAVGLETDGGSVVADAYVVALPVESVLGVLPEALHADPFFARAASPASGVRSVTPVLSR